MRSLLCRDDRASEVAAGPLLPAADGRVLRRAGFRTRDRRRASDSLSLRQFLGLELNEAPPDHSTISRTRRRVQTHQAVFTWILERLAAVGLMKGQTVGVDATTLEANAALRSLVRRDTGESYETFLTGLATTISAGLQHRPAPIWRGSTANCSKKASNDDWTHPHDPDSRITKMKDGTTHLAHKAEHAVDLETGAVVAVTVQPADAGDTKTIEETLTTASENVEKAHPESDGIQEFGGGQGVSQQPGTPGSD